MPLPERVIQPTGVSRGTLQFNVPDVLEGVTNGTLANIIRQLSSLSRHAEEMFGNLFKEAEAVASRSSNIQARIDRLAIRVTQLDSTVEEVSLQDIQLRKAFRSTQLFDQQVVSKETMPKAMLEAYLACDKPPPLDKLNPYREDGKDGLKFYTDPTYFFELWRQEMLKDTERMMHDRGKKPGKSANASGQKSSENRHKKRVRQPGNTTEKQRQAALKRGEYLMQPQQQNNSELDPNSYPHPVSTSAADHQFESQMMSQMQRPNSIEVKSAAYYQQLQLQQQQEAQSYNQRQPGGLGYANQNNENIYMPRILKNYDEHESSPRMYPPHAQFEQQQQNNSYEPQLSPSRVLGSPSRPSQPPPAPPPGAAVGSSPAGTPTRGSRAGSSQRESLPPPPPPPPTSEPLEIISNGHHHPPPVGIPPPGTGSGEDMLPPPPPNPDSNLLSARVPVEHLPPSPPPPPAPTVTTTSTPSSGAPPPAAPPPPPPPPPSDQMNGLRITNGDLKNNILNGKSSSPTKTDGTGSSQMILPKKKQMQPPHVSAQDGVRSDLLKAIRDGIALKKVEQRENAKMEEANEGKAQTDVASILARRVAVEMSDSDNENASDSEYDSDEWGDESTA